MVEHVRNKNAGKWQRQQQANKFGLEAAEREEES